MRIRHLPHLCGRFCQGPREKNRYFSTAPRIQDGRLHVGREDSPFRPLHVPLSYSFSREPLSLPLCTMRTHVHTHPHVYVRARASDRFSVALMCRHLLLSILSYVAMPVFYMMLFFFFFFTSRQRVELAKLSLRLHA